VLTIVHNLDLFNSFERPFAAAAVSSLSRRSCSTRANRGEESGVRLPRPSSAASRFLRVYLVPIDGCIGKSECSRCGACSGPYERQAALVSSRMSADAAGRYSLWQYRPVVQHFKTAKSNCATGLRENSAQAAVAIQNNTRSITSPILTSTSESPWRSKQPPRTSTQLRLRGSRLSPALLKRVESYSSGRNGRRVRANSLR
jgi:hypothetical protein